MSNLKPALLCTISFIFTLSLVAQQHKELGAVDWLRDLDQAKRTAAASDKPILVLFQEVPGCMTCQNYGSQVLSHPFIVEAIEDHFVPLAIFNNKGGKDRKVLNLYSEPSWNNPVIRFVDHQGKDLIERLNGNYRPTGLIEHMMQVMDQSSIEIPGYLRLALAELMMEEGGLDKITFSMFCFWTGEKTYGGLDGVAYTEAGFMDGHEVVNVYFDPNTISVNELIEAGQTGNSADAVYCTSPQHEKQASAVLKSTSIKSARTFRLDKEPQYYLSKSKFRSIPMSKLQRIKVNALLGQGKNPEGVLSPRQIRLGNDKSGIRYNSDRWMELLLGAD